MAVALEEAEVPILPCMAAIVFFKIELGSGAGKNLYLPMHVIQAERERTFVYVVNDNNDGSATLVKTSITVGQFTGGELLVMSGLETGQVVVTKGVRQLYDGMRVKYYPKIIQPL